MTSLCLSPAYTSTEGDSPAALGNRIAAAVIEAGLRDGSLERQHYADPSYRAVNEPLVVAQPGTTMHDPIFWQPLALDQIIAQNGIAVPGRVQSFIGAGWGHVRGFALPASQAKGLPIDPGKPPFGTADSASYKQQAVEVIRASAELDASDATTIDIGPGARGDNPLGTNGGDGYERQSRSPASPTPPNLVRRADFARHRDRVLGGRPELRDAAGPLERARQRRLRLPAPRRAHRSRRRGPAEVGRAALLRPQRRRARRGDRGVGDQAQVQRRPPDLDDPLPGGQRPVDRPGRTVVRP